MSMSTARIEELPKLSANFSRPARTRVFKGGRGSGKTRGIAKRSALRVYQLAEMGVEGVFLASREHLNSLDESSMEEIKAAIRSEPWLADYFDIGEKFIRTKNRRISYAFAGLRHNLDSLKSKSRIIGNWTDEAEGVSDAAWRKLIPTIREEGDGWLAENWISYNPESPDSATHRRFVQDPADDCIVTQVNWRDNLWFPDILNKQRMEDQRLRADIYDHVWEGAFLSQTEAQVFNGKVSVREFEAQGWDGPYQGVDFGFRPDPLVALRMWIHDNRLWIEYEAYGQNVEIDAMPRFINSQIPGFEKYVSRADSAEPKTISYARRTGMPRMEAVKKWPNSVIEGVRWMRGFEEIVIHPRCPGTAKDFRRYSHKTDRLTGDILPELVDADNHGPDAARYALAPLIKQVGKAKTGHVVGMH